MSAISATESPQWLRELRALLQWWWGGLTSCLPRGVRRGRHLVVEPEGDELVVFRATAKAKREMLRLTSSGVTAAAGDKRSKLPKNDHPVLRVPTGSVLRRELELPLSVEADLASMLQLGMDRYTPFSADQVYYDYRVVDRDRDSGRLKLLLLVALKSVVDPWLAAMTEHGIAAQSIDVAPDGEGVNLLPAEGRTRGASGARKLNLVLLLVAVLLGVAVIAIPLWRQHTVHEDLSKQLTDARRQAADVVDLRDELDRTVAASRFLVSKKHQTRPVVEVLNALTELLPDDTWVQQLSIKDGLIQMRGESAKAAALVGRLAKSPLFTNPVFRSQIARNPNTGKESFNLEIRITAGDTE